MRAARRCAAARDLLIEHLHKINDKFRPSAGGALAALAQGTPRAHGGVRGGDLLPSLRGGEGASACRRRSPCGLRLDRVQVAGARRLPPKLKFGTRDTGPLQCATAARSRRVWSCIRTRLQWATPAKADAAFAPAPVPGDKYIDYGLVPEGRRLPPHRRCLAGARTREDITKIMEDSGLRGLGGAGFLAGRKWRLVAAEPEPRVMAVNIDEGEPGTFKDRWYLERDPHRFLEGMLIAAWCAGVGEIWIYLRDEYAGCRAILERELEARLREAVRAAADPSAPRRGRLYLRRRVGDDRIHRRQARHAAPAPAYVAQVGLFGRPTLRAQHGDRVLGARDREEGAQWFHRKVETAARGCVRSRCPAASRKPGVHLAPAGITVRELIDEYCGGMLDGHQFYAYLPGGASGGITRVEGDIPLDFDTLQPHGLLYRLGRDRGLVAQ